MNTSRCSHASRAFTRTELAVTIIVLLFVVAGLLQVKAVRMREVQARQTCINNLKQIGLAHRVWPVTEPDAGPQLRSTIAGGTREHVLRGDVFRHFQVISNELRSARVLACPADSRRPPATFAGVWSNANISYFIGVDAEENHSNMLLSGDRNITNGLAPVSGLLTFTTANQPGWERPWHQGHGVLGLADGSVHQMTTAQLQAHIAKNPETNRIALPLP